MFGEQHTRPWSTDPAVCGTPPPRPVRGGGFAGKGLAQHARCRRPPSSGCSGGTAVCPGSAFLSEFCALHPALPVLPVPENVSAPTPPHGVGCPARGRGPGSWRGERAVPHEADECVRTESGGRRPSSARRWRCCGPQPGAAAGVTARAPAHGLVCVWCGQWASLLALDSGPRFWALGPCHMVISVALGWTQTACRCAWEGPRAWRGGPWRSPLAWSPSALPAPGPGRPGAGGPGGAARPTWSSWRGPLRAWGFQGAESHLRCFCAVAAVPWLPSSSSGVNLPAGWLQRVWARCRRKERISV